MNCVSQLGAGGCKSQKTAEFRISFRAKCEIEIQRYKINTFLGGNFLFFSIFLLLSQQSNPTLNLLCEALDVAEVPPKVLPGSITLKPLLY